MARIRFAGKYYPLPDDEVEEFKTNLIALAIRPDPGVLGARGSQG
jgi:hypothetical protein